MRGNQGHGGRRGRRDDDDNDNGSGGGPGGADAEVVIGDVRPIDGRGTNPVNPEFGATGSALLRLAEANYTDGFGQMVTDRPDARVISNIVVEQEGSEPNSAGASDFMWVWGQFIDHDLDLTRQGNTEPADMPVPAGDPAFDPNGTGAVTLPFFRATPIAGTGSEDGGPREFPTPSLRSLMRRWCTARMRRVRRAFALTAASFFSTRAATCRPMPTAASSPAT